MEGVRAHRGQADRAGVRRGGVRAVSNAWALRKRRIYLRLADLARAVAEGGRPDLSGWELRERIMQTLERLPRGEMDAWLAEHRQVREFVDAQSPPSATP